MAQATAARPRQKLRLTKLEFCSFVDTPAQQPATFRLIKRADGEGDELQGTWRIAKIGSGDNPLVHGWAFQCTDDTGAPYQDLQGDVITDDYISAAEEWFADGGAVDQMHQGEKVARAAFAYPIDPDVITACIGKEAGKATKVSGLMVAVRPTPEQLQKIRDKEWTGFSIAGLGTRTPVEKAQSKCPSCGAYGTPDSDGNCPQCGRAMKRAPATDATKAATDATKALWSTAEQNKLPDSSFLYIESGGEKDDEGKTTPRSLRHFPYKNADGAIDLIHLRNAIAQIPKSDLSEAIQEKVQAKAKGILDKQNGTQKRKRRPPVRKQAVLTSSEQGHQHQIDLDDPADGWSDQLTTSYNTSDGADTAHCHAWVYDATGKITIAEDSGHSHTVDAVVPADVIRQAQLNETGERCPGCGQMCEQGYLFCPKCGCPMNGNGVPTAPMSDDDDDESGPTVVVVSARAPGAVGKSAPEYAVGDRVEATVNHMPGMSGMTGEVTIANEGTPPYYAVRFDDQKAMPGIHKWLAENELKSAGSSEKRAPGQHNTSISTPSEGTPTVKSETKEPSAMTTDLNAKIRELEVQNAHLAKMATLTDAQRAHYNKLSADDQSTFINLTPVARQGVLDDITKADTVVYTSISGREYRKSDDLRMIELAQATDAATKMAQKSEVEKRDMEFEKRGNEALPHFAKGVKGNLRGRIMKAINGEFTDPAEYDEAMRMFKGADYALAEMEKSKGVNPHIEPTTASVASQQLEQAVNEFAKRNNMQYAAAFVQATATDPEIRRLYNETMLGN